MNQVVTLCESLLEISPLLVSDSECEVLMGRLLGLARVWWKELKSYNILEENEPTLQKVLELRKGLRSGMLVTLQLAVIWFQAERRR